MSHRIFCNATFGVALNDFLTYKKTLVFVSYNLEVDNKLAGASKQKLTVLLNLCGCHLVKVLSQILSTSCNNVRNLSRSKA